MYDLVKAATRLFVPWMAILCTVPVFGAEITIVPVDGPGVGFNDGTEATPVGGNDGTTLGAQRLIAAQYAADLWGARLHSDIEIVVEASFADLGCGAGSDTTGQGYPNGLARNWGSAPLTDIWYPIALANAIAETDLEPGVADIVLTFNEAIGSGACFGGEGFYLGLDGNSGAQIDMVTVALHHLTHGLGFSTRTDLTNGSFFQIAGTPDIFAHFLRDQSLGLDWPEMTNAQRSSSATDTGDLVWRGAEVSQALLGEKSRGAVLDGFAIMHAPHSLETSGDPIEVGDSVEHFDESATGQLMRPGYHGPNHEVGLAEELLFDLGWEPRRNADLSLTASADNPLPGVGQQVTITLTLANAGPGSASRVVVENRLPVEMSYVSHTGPGTYDQTTGIWDLDSLSIGSSVDLELTYRLDQSGSLTYAAEVMSTSQGDPDSLPGNGLESEDDFASLSLSGVGTLLNDQVVTGLAAEVGQWRYYQIQVPPGQRLLNLSTFGGRGDLDLYVRQGALPTLDSYDHRPLQTGNAELLNIADPAPGTWYVGIHGFLAFSESNLHVQHTDATLFANITRTRVAECPTIEVVVAVGDESGTITGLQRGDFTIREGGGGDLIPDSAQEVEAGTYLLRYVTPVPDGGDIYPRVTVEVDGNSASDISVFTNCTPKGGAIDVWIEDQEVGIGQTVIVPIRVQPIEIGYRVGSFEIDLSYNDDKLAYRGMETRGSLTEEWDLVFDNGAIDGRVFIAAADTQDLDLVADTDGILLAIMFTVKPELEPGTCTPVGIDRMVFNNGAPLALTENGLLCVPPVSPGPTADLELRKIADRENLVEGETIEFEITVKNVGPDTATGVTVSDRLRGALSYVSHQGGDYDPGSGVWDIGLLHFQDSATLTITATVEDQGAWSNRAQVRTSEQADPDSFVNNGIEQEDDQETIWFDVSSGASADLSLSKLVDNTTPKLGEHVTFSLSLTNSGPDIAEDVVVTDRYVELQPTALGYVSHDGPGHFDFETGEWSLDSLAPAQTVTLELVMSVSTLAPVTNTVEVTEMLGTDPDSTPDNEDQSEDDQSSITLSPLSADLSLALTVDDAAPNVGDEVQLTLTLDNAGPDAADMVAVLVELPDGLSHMSHAGDGYYDSGTDLWQAGAVALGTNPEIVISAVVVGPDPMDVIAEIASSDQGDPDSTPGNGIAAEDDQDALEIVPQLADLEVVLETDNPIPDIGDAVTLTLSVDNQGPDPTSGLALMLDLPLGLDYVSDSGTARSSDFDAGSGTWTIGVLPVGETRTIEIVARKDTAGLKRVTAEVLVVDQFDPDSTPDNGNVEEDDFDEVVLGAADLELAVTVDDDEPDLTQQIQLTYTCTNNGPDPASGVAVDLGLTRDLVYVTHDTGLFDPETGVWTIPAIAEGESSQIVVTVRVYGASTKHVIAEVVESDLRDPNSTPGNGDPDENDYASLLIKPTCSSQATIVLIIADAPGAGFNDPTPVSPVGGNSGTTLGEQRRIAFEQAAAIWAQSLRSNVTIEIEAKFEAQPCSPTSGVLASAGPKDVVRDFPGAPLAETWFPVALGNSLAGTDLKQGIGDVRARFNLLDNNNGCFTNRNWYYGLDANPGTNFDFVSVAVHELAHGLGFLTFVDGGSGQPFMGYDDIYMFNLENDATGKTYPQMSNGERAAAAVSGANLQWVGETVTAASGLLSEGVDPDGNVEMYAPSPFQPGSSVSHFSTTHFPDQLLEPSYTAGNHDVGLALELMYDLGWSCTDLDEPRVDLALTMVLSEDEPAVGALFSATIEVVNEAAEPAGGVTVSVPLPDGLSFQSADMGDYDQSTGTWTIGALEPGASESLVLTLTAVEARLIRLVAEIETVAQDDVDSTPGNGDEDEDDFAARYVTPRAVPKADLSLSKVVDDPAPGDGDQVTYTLTVSNRGPEAAGGVEVRDLLPDGVDLVSADGAYAGSVWSVGDLTVGESRSLNITVAITGEGNIVNRAEVIASSLPDPDSTPDNGLSGEDDQAEVSLYVQPELTPCEGCARVVINNLDGPGEGFNNPTPVDPVPGNPGTTLGEQRLFAFSFAANQFCRYLASDTPIVVNARFDALYCDPTRAVLGSASPTLLARDFSGAPLAATWYPGALTNALYGADVNGSEAEIEAVFNSAIDNNERDDQNLVTRAIEADCASSTVDYVVENKQTEIKFEDAPLGLGEDRVWMRDTFEIEVETLGATVGVAIKAGPSKFSQTLVGEGDEVFLQNGFRVVLKSIVGRDFTFIVEAVCNSKALSHIVFDFGDGAGVITPTSSYQASRLTCEDLWNANCEVVDPDGGGGTDGGGDNGDGGDSGDGGDNGDGGGDGEDGNGSNGGDDGPGPEACVGDVRWYYGLDGNSGDQFDFVTVVLHELIHGLGFSTQVDLDPQSNTRGQTLLGIDDVFMTMLADGSTGLTWDQMTPQERFASAGDVQDLYWVGSRVTDNSAFLDHGANDDGFVRMYASDPVQPGSTVEHWSPGLSPNALMEPAYSGPNHDPSLAVFLLQDLGWNRYGCVDLELSAEADNLSPANGDDVTYAYTLTNMGPEDGHEITVAIELDAGLSYQSDSGGGSFSGGIWTVGDMLVGQSVQLELTARAGAGGKRMVAEVETAAEADFDSIPGNRNPFEDDYARIDIGAVDIDLMLGANIAEPNRGGFVAWTLTLGNDGPDDASGVRVALALDAGLGFISDFSGGTFDPETGIWDADSVVNGGTRELVFVTRADGLGLQTVTAEVIGADQFDTDSTPANNVPGEDDQTAATVQVIDPSENFDLEIRGVYPFDCPVMKIKVIARQNGEPLSGLTAGMFRVAEDNIEVPFTLEEGAEPGLYWFTYTSLSPDGRLHLIDITLTDPARGADPILVYAFKPFTNCDVNGCTEIFNNVVVPYISGFPDSWRCFWIDVPPNQRQLTFDTFGGSGDVDLYVSYGSPAGLGDYDYRVAISGNDENVTIDFPTGGTYWVGLHGFGEYTETNLVASYWAAALELDVVTVFTADCPDLVAQVEVSRDGQPVDWLTTDDFRLLEDGVPVGSIMAEQLDTPGTYNLHFTTVRTDGGEHELLISADILGDIVYTDTTYSNCLGDCIELENNVVVPDLAGQSGSFRCFYLDVPVGADVLEFKSWDGFGDADLYVRYGAQPGIDTYDRGGLSAGNGETIRITEPAAGRWYCAVRGFTDYWDANLLGRYYNLDLETEITGVDTGMCPDLMVFVRVTSQDGPLSGLGTQNFRIGENDGVLAAVSVAAEGSPGRYTITYRTDLADGRETFINLETTYNQAVSLASGSYSQCDRTGPGVEVFINKENVGLAGDTVEIPIMLGAEGSYDVGQVRFRLRYDPDLLEYVTYVPEGSLTQGWDLFDDTATRPGEIVISAATQVPSRLVGEMRLMNLRFVVDEAARVGDCTELELPRDAFAFNNGRPGAAIEDGCFCVTDTCPGAIGDVDEDGDAAEAFDALQILRDITSIPTVYDPIPLCVKDTNCSGDARLIDAVLVLQRVIRVIDGYCEEPPLTTRSSSDFDIQLTQDAEINPGQGFDLELSITRMPYGPVFGYSFDLDFDPDMLTFTGFAGQEGAVTERWGDPIVNFDQPGRLSFTHINPFSPIDSEGVLIRLRGVAAPNADDTEITFSRFELAEDTEPLKSFGPISIDIEGGPCFDVSAFEDQVDQWPQTTILDMLATRACLEQ